MRIVLAASCLVVLAGLALGASLSPLARVAPVAVSAPGIGVPGVPALVQAAPVPAAPARAAAPAPSILKGAGDTRDPAPPVVAAPPFVAPRPAPADNTAPKVTPTPAPCVVKPYVKGRDRMITNICPPLPARDRSQSGD